MTNNKQHVVATTNEILDTKSGKTLDRIVGKGGGGNEQKDVIINVAITQYDEHENFRADIAFHSCNYDTDSLNHILDDLTIRDDINYYARLIFNNEHCISDMHGAAFGPTPIKLPIASFKSGSDGIQIYFYGPWIDTASGYLQNNHQYNVTIPSSYRP